MTHGGLLHPAQTGQPAEDYHSIRAGSIDCPFECDGTMTRWPLTSWIPMIRPFHSIACFFTLAAFTTLACDDAAAVVVASGPQEAGAPDGATPDARAPDGGAPDGSSPEAGADAATEAGTDAGPRSFGGLTVDTAPED